VQPQGDQQFVNSVIASNYLVAQIVRLLGRLSYPNDSDYRIELFDHCWSTISFNVRTDSTSCFSVCSSCGRIGSISNNALYRCTTYPKWSLHSIGSGSFIRNRNLDGSRIKLINFRLSSIKTSVFTL
jgi:hypothetical protein